MTFELDLPPLRSDNTPSPGNHASDHNKLRNAVATLGDALAEVDPEAAQAILDQAQAAADAATDISNISTSDDVVSALVLGTAGAGPKTRAGLTASFDAITHRDESAASHGVSATVSGSANSAALAAAITAARSAGARVVLPGGALALNSSVAISGGGSDAYTHIVGAGRGKTILKPPSNTPAINFDNPLAHSVTMRDLSIRWDTQQTGADAIGVRLGVSGGGGDGGFFHHVYEGIEIVNAYRGWELLEGNGQQTLWNSTWRDIVCSNLKNGAVVFNPQSPIGIPRLSFHGFAVMNANGGPVTTGPCFHFVACQVDMIGLDLEGWYDELFEITGGGFCKVLDLHVEHHRFAAGFSRLAYIGPSVLFAIEAADVAGATTAGNTDGVYLLAPESGSIVHVDGLTHSVDTTLGTAYIKQVMYSGVRDFRVTLERIVKYGGGLANPGEGGNGIYYAGMYAPPRPRTMTVQTANYAVTVYDSIVIMNGTGLTATLPAASSVSAGTQLTVKNINSSSLTVASAGGSIDGGSTQSVAQWAKASYVTNGTDWLTV
jgi:hypothetical protein